MKRILRMRKLAWPGSTLPAGTLAIELAGVPITLGGVAIVLTQS